MQRGEFDLKSLAMKGESELSDEVVRLFSGHGIPRLCEGGWYLGKVDIVTTPGKQLIGTCSETTFLRAEGAVSNRVIRWAACRLLIVLRGRLCQSRDGESDGHSIHLCGRRSCTERIRSPAAACRIGRKPARLLTAYAGAASSPLRRSPAHRARCGPRAAVQRIWTNGRVKLAPIRSCRRLSPWARPRLEGFLQPTSCRLRSYFSAREAGTADERYEDGCNRRPGALHVERIATNAGRCDGE